MKHIRNTPPRKFNGYSVAIICLAALSLVLICRFALQTDAMQYQLRQFGLTDRYHLDNTTTVSSWDSCLDRLHIDADVVFLGDSLTRGHDFQADYPELSIVNLGLSGDTILDVTRRVFMLKTVRPEKVFLMAGVNSLRNEKKIGKYYAQYVDLCEKIRETVPNAKLYIISVLPVSADHDNRFLGTIRGINNDFIRRFNDMIQQYANLNNLTYIDLYQYYEYNGSLNPAYAQDSIHITDDAYRFWIDAVRDYMID